MGRDIFARHVCSNATKTIGRTSTKNVVIESIETLLAVSVALTINGIFFAINMVARLTGLSSV